MCPKKKKKMNEEKEWKKHCLCKNYLETPLSCYVWHLKELSNETVTLKYYKKENVIKNMPDKSIL